MKILLSERVFERQLDLPVVNSCAGHTAERPCTQRSSGLAELRRVERVEEFGPEQQLMPLIPGHPERLRQREIKCAQARPDQGISRRSPILADASDKCARIEPERRIRIVELRLNTACQREDGTNRRTPHSACRRSASR